MAIITQNFENEQHFSNRAYDFFKRYKIGEILHKSNAYKHGGIAVVTVVSNFAVPILDTYGNYPQIMNSDY